MLSFAQLGESLAIGTLVREEEGVRAIRTADVLVEQRRITFGGDEWVVLSAYVGASAPSWHGGLGALVRCRNGWALRLTLPLHEVTLETVGESIHRLAHEVTEMKRSLANPVHLPAVAMWAE